MKSILNIVIPMAGRGTPFINAGYAFPKPLIDINGKTMIEVVVDNLLPKVDHKFIFICQKEHYDKFDLYNILKKATNNKFEVIPIHNATQGAACTVLTAINHINNENDLLIANADQFIEGGINEFIADAQRSKRDGLIMTFEASHPKWSYARINKKDEVIETAEKKVISENATVGLYYFKKGSEFVNGAQSMMHKNIRHNNEFFVCPVYNELILQGKVIGVHKIKKEMMHSIATPEDLTTFLKRKPTKARTNANTKPKSKKK